MTPKSHSFKLARAFEGIWIVFLLAVAVPCNVGAAEIRLKIVDPKGRPVDGAVAVFTPSGGAPVPKPITAEISQARMEFQPPVTIVPVGSRIRFPNKDTVAHHVYSFSPAKKFDIPLYAGEKAPEVIVDTPGVIALGCNIHDGMRAHVYVVRSPFFGVSSADGRIELRGVPAGRGEISVWHPLLRGPEVLVEWSEGKETVEVTLPLRPDFKSRRPQSPGSMSGYP